MNYHVKDAADCKVSTVYAEALGVTCDADCWLCLLHGKTGIHPGFLSSG